jgi:hypothetical protein
MTEGVDILTKQDASPGIGTPESALRSCVTLIASVTGQPEALTEKYLDLYYQVRRAAEDAAAREEILKCWDVGMPMAVLPEEPAAKTGPSITPSTAEAVPLPQARQAAGGGKGKKVDFDEVLASASAGAKMPPEKKRSEPWGSVKREIRERFLDLRSKGMTIAQTVNLSGKKLTDGDVMNIMNGGKAEMKVYNALEEAMDKWEQVTAAEADAAAVSKESTV